MERKFCVIITILLFAFNFSYAQQQDELGGAVEADSVHVTRSQKRADKRAAAVRKKSRELTRDLIEKGRLQFEPEVGFYHGNQVNMIAGHYSKVVSNIVNTEGAASGWHEDTYGGKFSGKPLLQILNGRLYCNLDPILTTSRPEIIGKSARDDAAYGNSAAAIDFESSDEILSNWHAFDTECYKIQNFKETGDYLLTFDVVVNQFNIINNTTYNHFLFQCIINILDGRMSMRIVAGEKRICATYFGYMNILRGNSF